MASEHTPGPWYVVPPPWDNSGCVVNTQQDPHQGKLICVTDELAWTDGSLGDRAEWQANARLIAAAPNLLDACDAALSYVDSDLQYQEVMYNRVDRDSVILRKQLIAAIAKAKGRNHATD